MRVIILAAIAAIASPATAADQFDLVCAGKNSGKPIEKHYRVDLSAKQWCQDKCTAVEAISDVQPAKIVFRSKPKAFERDDLIVEEVDRTTGAWRDWIMPWWVSNGTCEVAPFSGFSTAKTKF